ncbi:MAG: DUF2442 domain-containing protein [Chloroflexi bacterium]|nr:DUF2442 domain-containing protein [Chloroflexota bacterium]
MNNHNDGFVTNPQHTYTELVGVRLAQPLDGFKVHVTFTDGTERDIDLEQYLHGPIFEPIRNNPELFRSFFIDIDTIAWSNGADIAPETLYYGDQPAPWAVEETISRRPARKPRARPIAKSKTKRRVRAPAR